MKITLFFLNISFCLFNCAAQNISLYVGTYTNGDSEGIYQLQFNTETGILSNLKVAITTDNPSFLVYAPNKKFIYSVNQTDTGFASAYKVHKNGTLSFINKFSSHGNGPCHIAINKTGTKVVVSNYSGGTVAMYPVNTDGSLNDASQIFNHNADKIASHAHSAQFFEDHLFVADLGRNAVYQYRLKNDSYQLISPTIVKTAGNPGPRHFSITKNGQFLYVINEYGSSITSIEKTKSGFKQIDNDSTLGVNYSGKNDCADIHLSKDERFLYGSNRGENTIAVFKRDVTTGTLEKIQNISVQGNWPRNFTLDPTGTFLLVANKKSNNISVFKINKTTGKLTYLNNTEIPTPVCLLF